MAEKEVGPLPSPLAMVAEAREAALVEKVAEWLCEYKQVHGDAWRFFPELRRNHFRLDAKALLALIREET